MKGRLKSIFFHMSQFSKQVIDYLENTEQSVFTCVISGLFAIILRNFIEAFSQKSGNYLNLDAFYFALNVWHFSLSYIVMAMIYVLLFYFATRTDIVKIIKVIFPSLILLWLAPIIDLFSSYGRGRDVYYFHAFGQSDLFKNYFTYVSYFSGITIGMKVEVFIILLGCFCYFRFKGVNTAFSFIYTLLAYSCNFIFACSLIIAYKILMITGFSFHIADINYYMIYFYSFCLLVVLLNILWIAHKTLFLAIINDLRILKIVHYELMLFLGLLLGFVIQNKPIAVQLHVNAGIIPEVICISISIVFAAVFTIVMNNMFDVDIDKINSPHRPLIRQKIDIKMYEKAGWIALGISVYFACLAGAKACFIMMTMIALYYVYSVPPIRLKRVFLLSKLTISGSSLALVILGYLTVVNNLLQFPKLWYPIFLIGVTLSANLIDLKDQPGDALFGIKTLPVVLGLQRAKFITGAGYLLTTLAFYFVIGNDHMLLFLLGIGLAQFYFITKNPFTEWQPMMVHVGALFAVIAALCGKLAL